MTTAPRMTLLNFQALMPTPHIERILHFKIDPTHNFVVEAALVLCIDPRFWGIDKNREISTITAFLREKGWENKFVPLTAAGGIKTLVSGSPDERDSLLGRIEQEIKLHHPKVLAIAVHRDCGGYGYSKNFSSAEAESAQLYGDLWKAHQLLDERFGSKAKLEAYVFDDLGVERVSW